MPGMRERKLPVLVIGLYLAYFGLFVIGGPRAQSAYRDAKGEIVSEEAAYAAIESDNQAAELEAVQTTREHRVRWQPGLISQVLVINRAADLVEDELLESDARPEQLVRQLQRSQTGVLFTLIVAVFWCGGLVLALLALARNHWFARPMVFSTLAPSSLFLILFLLTVQRERLSTMDGNPYLITGVGLESLLFFLGAATLIRMVLPAGTPATPDDRFMSHQFLAASPAGRRFQAFGRAALQIAVISLTGLVISNLLLLPLFSLQLYFPELFTILISAGIVTLVVFYSTGYVRVSRKEDYRPDYFSGIAFLGFRILKNVGFLVSGLTLIGVIISMILLAAIFNINLLETFHLLEKPAKL